MSNAQKKDVKSIDKKTTVEEAKKMLNSFEGVEESQREGKKQTQVKLA